jgi:signal transduction histidine kinase
MLAWVLTALLLPVVWGYVAVLRAPSDGTVIYASSSLDADARWSDETGVVLHTADGSPAWEDVFDRATEEEPVRVLAVDGVPLADADETDLERTFGDRVTYSVTSGGQRQEIEVTLGRTPLGAVAARNVGAVLLWLFLALAGPLVFWHRPRDAAARAMLALTALVPIGMTAYPFGLQVLDFAGGRGVWPYVVGELANCLAWGTTLFFALVFPEPLRVVTRRPWLAWGAFLLPFALHALRIATWERDVRPGLAQTESLILLSASCSFVVIPLAAGILLMRLRQHTTRENRVAILLILSTVMAALILFVVLGVLPELTGGGWRVDLAVRPFALVIPMAGLVVAVLRYRLYDLDVIVRRSLLVLTATCVVGLVFLGMTWVLKAVADVNESEVLIGGLVAAMLLPLGRLVRQRLSRLVFGARDDAHQVVSELRGVGSAMTVEETLTQALTTLTRTLRLGYAGVEVARGEGVDPLLVAVGDAGLRSTVVQLEHQGRPWGTLALGTARSREPFGPRDRRLLDDVGSQLAALVASLMMNEELRRSRLRIITAREEERRRIRRDLHDGLGPALAGQSMQLQYARELLKTSPAQVDPVLERMSSQVRNDIAEIRRLVDDLRPKVLDQLGLVSALRQQADGASLAVGATDVAAAPMPWSVRAEEVEPLPAAVEVAAYRIVLEAVNNAAKHSRASRCEVDLARVNGHLEIVIADDGTGLLPERGVGVGLGSMRERAEELGGTFTLTSDRDHGTTIAVRLPLELD